LIGHIGAIHEKMFECSLCPCKYVQEDHLNKHIAAVHEKKIQELKVTSKTYENRNTNEKLKSFEIFLK
jgi:hypothetical protein